MKLDRKKAIEIIVKAAQNYEHNLKDKRFLIIYQGAERYAYISKGVDIQKLLMQCKEERSMLV